MVDAKIETNNIVKDNVTTFSMQTQQRGLKADFAVHGDTLCKQQHRGFQCVICLEDFRELGKARSSKQIVSHMPQMGTHSPPKTTITTTDQTPKQMECDPMTQFLENCQANSKPPDDEILEEELCMQLIQLLPCQHIMCNDCFFMFPMKLCTDKCPACTQQIMSYIVMTPKEQSNTTFSEEESKDLDFESEVKFSYNLGEETDFQELLKTAVDKKAGKKSDTEEGFGNVDCLDHAYFIEELTQLLDMQKQTEQDYWRRDERPTNMEQQALDQIADRALDLQYACNQFIQFDPIVMLTEVNELSEMLCKIKSGKFKSETGDDAKDLLEESDYSMYPNWDDEFFQIENQGNKPLKKVYMNNFTIEVKQKQSGKRNRKSKKQFKATAQHE